MSFNLPHLESCNRRLNGMGEMREGEQLDTGTVKVVKANTCLSKPYPGV